MVYLASCSFQDKRHCCCYRRVEGFVLTVCASTSYIPVKLPLSKQWDSWPVAKPRPEQGEGCRAGAGKWIRAPSFR